MGEGEGDGEGEGEGAGVGPVSPSPPQAAKARSAAKAEIADRLHNEPSPIDFDHDWRLAQVPLAEFIFALLTDVQRWLHLNMTQF